MAPAAKTAGAAAARETAADTRVSRGSILQQQAATAKQQQLRAETIAEERAARNSGAGSEDSNSNQEVVLGTLHIY